MDDMANAHEIEQTIIGGLPLARRRAEHDPAAHDYDYFAYAPSDRLPDLRKQIEEREKKLFELEIAAEVLDGCPADINMISHDDFATVMENQKRKAESNGDKWVQTQVCPCSGCELARVQSAVTSQVFRINKLKALYTRLGATS